MKVKHFLIMTSVVLASCAITYYKTYEFAYTKGHTEGYDEGYDEGYAEGHSEGWNEVAEEHNRQVRNAWRALGY